MKYKHIILFAALALITTASSAQIQFTAGINYESGVPSGAPSSTGSRLRVDLASGRIYQWSAANTTWRTLGQGIDIVAGCAAPAYTPGYAQSVFAVNGCSTPELYYYNGTQWKQVAGGGGGTTYYAGTGIDIDANDTISIDTVPRLIFYSDQTYSGGVGAMRWNSDDGTLDLGLKGGNVTLQLGQELVQPVKHATNDGLDNGKVVYITGSTGDNKKVLYARANNEATSSKTLGVMTETVTGGSKGFCTTFGLVRNINTSNLTEGGAVWLSKDTAGAMTAVRPEAPNHGVFIGFCVRKHASTGVIFVNVQNGYELNELHNVYVPSPTNGQVLTYVSGNSRWEAATVADQSATNELQTIDQFSLSGQTLSASLSSDGVAPSTVTLPVVGITAGTNVTVSSTGGNFTINAPNGAPTGSTGQVQFNNAGAFGASSNLTWDNSTNTLSTTSLYSSGTGSNYFGGPIGIGTTTLNNSSIRISRAITGATLVSAFANNSMINSDVTNQAWIYSSGPSTQSAAFTLGTLVHYNAYNFTPNGASSVTTQYGFWASSLLTAASNNYGFVGDIAASGSNRYNIYMAGTAPNYMAGNTSIGVTSASARLHVQGSGATSGTWTAQMHNSSGTNNALMVRDDGIVAMGTASPNSSAKLEISSTTQGVLFPRMTTTQRNAISTPADGLVIYNTTDNKLQVRAAGAWVDLH